MKINYKITTWIEVIILSAIYVGCTQDQPTIRDDSATVEGMNEDESSNEEESSNEDISSLDDMYIEEDLGPPCLTEEEVCPQRHDYREETCDEIADEFECDEPYTCDEVTYFDCATQTNRTVSCVWESALSDPCHGDWEPWSEY